METGLKEHLERLDEIFAARPDYLQTLRFVQLMVNNVVRELTALPDISKANVDVASVADQTASAEYYRSETHLISPPLKSAGRDFIERGPISSELALIRP